MTPDDLGVSVEQLADCKLQVAQVHPHVLVTPPQKRVGQFRKPAGASILMCGKAGEVYLMNMSVVHAPSINASKKARMMLTARYLNPVLA